MVVVDNRNGEHQSMPATSVVGFSPQRSKAPPWDELRLFIAFLVSVSVTIVEPDFQIALAARSEPLARFGDQQPINDHKNLF